MAQTPRGHLLWGVADERWLYSYEYGFFSPHASWPNATNVEPRLRLVDGGGGRAAFEKRAATRLVDRVGLLDPFLARQTATHDPRWRTGHATRRLPRGYVETLWEGENRLADRRLASLYDDLVRAQRGPLVDAGRLALILRLAAFRPPEPRPPADRFAPLCELAAEQPWGTTVEIAGAVQMPVPTPTRGLWQLVEGVESLRWSLLRDDALVGQGFIGPGRRGPMDALAGDTLIFEPLCPQADCPRLRLVLQDP